LTGLTAGAVILRAVAENGNGVILADAQLGPALVPVVLTPSRYATKPLLGKSADFPAPAGLATT
jgi:hypothetical protein